MFFQIFEKNSYCINFNLLLGEFWSDLISIMLPAVFTLDKLLLAGWADRSNVTWRLGEDSRYRLLGILSWFLQSLAEWLWASYLKSFYMRGINIATYPKEQWWGLNEAIYVIYLDKCLAWSEHKINVSYQIKLHLEPWSLWGWIRKKGSYKKNLRLPGIY